MCGIELFCDGAIGSAGFDIATGAGTVGGITLLAGGAGADDALATSGAGAGDGSFRKPAAFAREVGVGGMAACGLAICGLPCGGFFACCGRGGGVVFFFGVRATRPFTDTFPRVAF